MSIFGFFWKKKRDDFYNGNPFIKWSDVTNDEVLWCLELFGDILLPLWRSWGLQDRRSGRRMPPTHHSTSSFVTSTFYKGISTIKRYAFYDGNPLIKWSDVTNDEVLWCLELFGDILSPLRRFWSLQNRQSGRNMAPTNSNHHNTSSFVTSDHFIRGFPL